MSALGVAQHAGTPGIYRLRGCTIVNHFSPILIRLLRQALGPMIQEPRWLACAGFGSIVENGM
jgi:hypothetical protein